MAHIYYNRYSVQFQKIPNYNCESPTVRYTGTLLVVSSYAVDQFTYKAMITLGFSHAGVILRCTPC